MLTQERQGNTHLKPFVQLQKVTFSNSTSTWSDLRISSLHCGFSSPTDRCFTPESCRLLLVSSSSLRLEDWELRTDARLSQLFSDRLQPLSLKKNMQHKSVQESLCIFFQTSNMSCFYNDYFCWFWRFKSFPRKIDWLLKYCNNHFSIFYTLDTINQFLGLKSY